MGKNDQFFICHLKPPLRHLEGGVRDDSRDPLHSPGIPPLADSVGMTRILSSRVE
jgi:hypothetical protein